MYNDIVIIRSSNVYSKLIESSGARRVHSRGSVANVSLILRSCSGENTRWHLLNIRHPRVKVTFFNTNILTNLSNTADHSESTR